MESDLFPEAGGIKGINLDNYFPNQRSYHSVVYYHKKFLNNLKEEKLVKTKIGGNTSKSKGKKKFTLKRDKTQQYNNDTINQTRNKHPTEAEFCNSVLNNLRFVKKLVPLVIPPVEDSSSPIYYTIKTSKKHKKQEKNPRDTSIEKDLTYSKEKMHKFETDKKRKNKPHRESCSARESLDPSSQNTLDDLNLNINQSCSFSESTEVKSYKREPRKVVNDNAHKYFVSSSFDALATESINGESNKIKIHLMNDSDKAIFSESIKNPIINAVKDCLSQLKNNTDVNTELKFVQRILKCNILKLDEILDRLACLEKIISTNAPQTQKDESKPRVQSAGKASKLEGLGKDLIEEKEDNLSEEDFSEEYNIPKRRLRCSGKSVVVAINENFEKEEKKKKESLGGGEEVSGVEGLNASSSISQQVVKPERPNRIPARFCWTDADRLK